MLTYQQKTEYHIMHSPMPTNIKSCNCSLMLFEVIAAVEYYVTQGFLWRYAPERRTGTFFQEKKIKKIYIINK